MEKEKGITTSLGSDSLKDVLELVLDKGIVIAGDIQIKVADVDLLTIKIRLLVAGADKAKEMGIDWWEHDPYLTSKVEENQLEKGKETEQPEKGEEKESSERKVEYPEE